MAISHASYIHKPADYVAPVDLNLLGKVLQFKQAQYDSGVAKTQSAIDNLAQLDVVKDVDKSYLNSKLNNLVSTINGIGGADFSDPNITNQIAGLSSQIYGDDKVINAVANTKKFRYVQKFYTDMKEKKPKDWNPANEWYDMNKFNSWLQDGQIGTSPTEGAGRVTPYHKYEEDWQKMFDKIVQSANIKQDVDDKGNLVWRTTTQKIVSPERIWETASKMLNPNQRGQIGIEGRYTYNNLPISELTKAYDSETYQKVGVATDQLKDYQAKYKGATSIEDQEQYEKLIAEKQGEINGLLAPIRKNQEQIKENLYLNDKLKGLQARYAFNQSTTKLQLNAAEAFRQRQNLSVAQFQQKQQKEAIDQQIELLDKGLMWHTDELGNRTIIRDPSAPRRVKNADGTLSLDYGGLETLQDAPEEQKTEFTRNTIDSRKEELIKDNTKQYDNFIQEFARIKGIPDVIITDLMDDGHIQTVIDPEIKKSVQKMMDSWDAMSKGLKINYEELDPMFKSFAGNYQKNRKEIEALDKFEENIEKSIVKEFSMTTEEYHVNKQYQKLNQDLATLRSKNTTTRAFGAPGIGAPGPAIESKDPAYLQQVATLQGQINSLKPFVENERVVAYNKGVQQRRDALLASASVKFNLPGITFQDDKNKNVAKMIAGNATAYELYNKQGKPLGKTSINFENIDVQSKEYSSVTTNTGTSVQPTITFKYKTGTGAEDFEIRKVILVGSQPQMLGFGTEIKELKGYRLGLHLNGEVNNVLTISGRGYDLKYDIVKYKAADQNDQNVFVRVRKGNNPLILHKISFTTLEQAEQFMERHTKFKTIDEAMLNLTNASK